MKFTGMRPRASMVVAVVALVAALGGTAYAATKFDSSDIVNRSLQGKDVANDTLGGKQINESKLGAVPTATDATTLEGQTAADQKIRWLLAERDRADRGAVGWLHRSRRVPDEQQRLRRLRRAGYRSRPVWPRSRSKTR